MFSAESIPWLHESDLIFIPIYFFFIMIFAYVIRNITLYKAPSKKYFIPGMLVKIIGGLSLGAVYGFYYHGGDTFYYYYDSKTFDDSIKQSWGLFFKLLMLPANKYTTETYDSTWWLTLFRDPSSWMAVKVYGIISIFSFHSYPAMAMIISVLSFSGAWAMYRTFADLYPQLYRPFAYCVLFIPSVFFWGSGVLKDSITFGCLGWITFCSYKVFFQRQKIVLNLIVLFFTGYIAMMIKAYIIISFLPALMFWIFLTYRSKIPNKFIRVVSGPALFTISLAFGYVLVRRLGQEFAQFSFQNVLTTAQTYHEWHSFLAQNDNASGYSLGNITGTWQSVVATFPFAVNVTLFRPYLWEAHSLIMLLSALESTFIMGFTIYIIFKNGLRRPFSAIMHNPTVFFCLFFSITFAFSVGFTAYNFGALVRYKIPCIPYYLIALIILNQITAEERKKLNEERLKRRAVFEMNAPSLQEEEAQI